MDTIRQLPNYVRLLFGLLRDRRVATVDKLLAEMKTHVQGNADLTRQASNGWVRVLHFGDHYGTAHARKVGREFLDQLKPATQPSP